MVNREILGYGLCSGYAANHVDRAGARGNQLEVRVSCLTGVKYGKLCKTKRHNKCDINIYQPAYGNEIGLNIVPNIMN